MCALAGAQDGFTPSESKSFSATYRFLSSVTPIIEGSPEEKTVVEYIQRFLVERNIPFDTADFSKLTSGHSYSVSIETIFPGTTPDELIVVAPLNGRKALNLALALNLAETYALRDNSLTLRILFPGAEFGEEEIYPIGSHSFLSTYFPEGNSTVLYLDFDLPPDRIVVRSGDRGYVSPYWLLKRCLTGLDEAGLAFLVRGNETQFFRLGVAANPAPINAYLANGYPTISLQSSRPAGPEQSVEKWAASLLDAIDSLLQHPTNPIEWDRHYLSFQVRSFSIIIRERTYVITLLILTGLLVLYPVILSRRFRSYAASIAINFWALPMLLLLVFLLLLLGTFLIEGLSLLKGYPDYWTTRPAVFFLLKLMTAVFLFSLLSRRLKRLPFPRRGRFYSAAALLILISDIFILGAIDLSLAYYVFWACIWAFFFSLAPNRALKAICLILSPVWLIKAAYDIFTIPTMEIAREMILARASGNLLIAFILFPFLLMLIRLDFMFRHPRKKTKRLLLTITYITLGLGCGGLTGFLAVSRPFGSENLQPVLVHEIQDLRKKSSYIEIESPAALGSLTFHTESGPVVVDSRSRSYTLEAPLRNELISVDLEASRFLRRATYDAIIQSEGLPSKLDVLLTSDEEIVIYDSSLPYSFRNSNTVEIYVGRHPPNPLRIYFTVPESLRGALEVAVEYTDPPTDYSVSGENIAVTQRLTASVHAGFGPGN